MKRAQYKQGSACQRYTNVKQPDQMSLVFALGGSIGVCDRSERRCEADSVRSKQQ